jgi:orotidine-5'-phosphate decarboxylase
VTQPFGERLRQAMSTRGQLCVGIDPHPFLLGEWQLPATAEGARSFGLRVVEAAAGVVPIVKPQVAFFERYGSAGFRALEEVLEAARDAGLLVIADAKRGDIGTTMDAYAAAWLGSDAPLRADAVTIAAYQGLGAASGALALARDNACGVFVLAATSNPEAKTTQTAVIAEGRNAGHSVAAGIVRDVLFDNAASGETDLGSVGLVLGATLDLDDFGIATSDLTSTPILAPGFGAQGALYSDIRRLYGSAAPAVLVAVSRGVLAAGPDGIDAAVREHATEVAECLA